MAIKLSFKFLLERAKLKILIMMNAPYEKIYKNNKQLDELISIMLIHQNEQKPIP